MQVERSCGILCHPTSMPGRYGIGELGDGLFRFLDFLAAAGQTLWQLLPLGPTGYGDSPYQPFSVFAGNPLLISLDALQEEGLLCKEELRLERPFPEDSVDYGEVISFKQRVLRCSYERIKREADAQWRMEWEEFCQQNQGWLDDYALFLALKQRFDWASWVHWEPGLALREEQALAHWREALSDEVGYHSYLQFLFARQWRKVREYARQAGITIIGDVPIFVGHDSADVWKHRDLFRLDDKGMPSVVAGVPPDYFSPTGQLWGNPLYRWDVMRDDGYAWWIERFKAALSLVDLVRLDHFRGFSGYWEVQANQETAANGRWVKGPGEGLLQAIERALGGLPIIAEDLGLITPDVVALREQFGLPGMRVLQFAFDGDPTNVHLPHNYERNSLAYTGTHDNDTTLGWYRSVDQAMQHRVRLYTGSDGRDAHWALIRLVMGSVAQMAIFPLQDALGLGSESRLNHPGRPHGNWAWRYTADQLQPKLAEHLRELAALFGRWRDPHTPLQDAEPATLTYEDM
jgi:4-alpha-glucanotransferase